MFKSVSAFAPICNPMSCPWGVKMFTGYLGDDKSKWAEYDATELAKKYVGPELSIMCDQGNADEFYTQNQLLPFNFIKVCKNNELLKKLEFRFQHNFDHSYYFIATFIETHIHFHARHLNA